MKNNILSAILKRTAVMLLAAAVAAPLAVLPSFAEGEEAESRGGFVGALYAAVGANAPEDAETAFDDVPEDSGDADAVAWAAGTGLVKGYGDGRFGPDDPITREQAAVIMYRCAQSLGKGFTGLWAFQLDYPDAADVSGYADEAVRWVVMNGILPEADGGLKPGAPVARGETEGMIELLLKTVGKSVDYLVLVNKLNALPDDWEDNLETVTVTNSLGDEVEVEREAYDAYLALKEELAEYDGVYVDLDSARRSVAAQQRIMDSFTEEYGADYAAKTVARPGYSEHHTGLALDLYLNIDGEDVYYNEDMIQYPEIWAKIHARLADHGFILRYLEGKEHITGYGYEPWHIRYVGDAAIAREIMSQPGMTLEVWLGECADPEVKIDLGESALYTEDELKEAIVQIKCRFAYFAGCELHSVTYAGDGCNTDENVGWLNEIDEGKNYTQAIEFLTDFHSPKEAGMTAWEPDEEYEDYQWWLARTDEGGWQLITWGY